MMNTNIYKESYRINWIDELKGFILIIVCLQHTHINIPFIGGNLIVICQAFHMPAFFFLSGILFSTYRYPNFISYIKRKTKTLLVPYILLSLLFSFLDPRLYDPSLMKRMGYFSLNICSSFDFLIEEFISIFYHGFPITIGPLWFVLTLFFVCILFFIIHYTLKGNNKGIIIYATFCLITGWILNLYGLILPYRFSTVFTASFFFTLGYLTRNKVRYIIKITPIRLGVIIIFLIPIYFYAININEAINLYINGLGNNFGGYILSTISGISLITSIFIFINKFLNNSIVQGILKNIARNALIILSVHYWVIICCRIFFYSIAKESYFPWFVTSIIIIVTTLAIPLFRNKLYMLIGKKKITVKESLSIK